MVSGVKRRSKIWQDEYRDNAVSILKPDWKTKNKADLQPFSQEFSRESEG